ncbi:MAG: BamA/TamA family outer membrane protein [Gemmatimonadota bacterium]|jgi:outer membrane protein insertion porin family
MRTDRYALSTLLVPALCALLGSPAAAQEGDSHPLLLVDPEATVGAVDFRFPSGSALDEDRLRQSIAYRGPGSLAGLRGALDFLPGISAPEAEAFSPLTLQRDVVRLRHLYEDAGFSEVNVDYDVSLDTAEAVVDLTFVVDQGEALRIDTVVVALTAQADGKGPASVSELPAGIRPEWDVHLARLEDSRGNRYAQQERARLETLTTDWFLERGYPWVRAQVARADTTGREVDVHLSVSPGPRARVDTLEFEGRQRLDEHVLAREVPIEPGDWYDSEDVAAGESQLYEIDLVRRALGDAPGDQPHDSTVTLQFRIDESRPRLLSGRVGWRSEEGMAGEAHWSHRDFLGGARTLTTSVTAETGWGALEPVSGRSAGVSAVVRQPYVWNRRLSATIGPFLRVRDDFRDRSLLFGLETALIYNAGPFRTVTAQHEISRLGVDEGFQLIPIRELVQSGPRPFDPTYLKSVFKISGSYGRLDDRLDPRSGWLVEPSVEVSGPPGVSDIEFFRTAVRAMAAIPLGRDFGLYLRGSAGRLFPFGESDPGGASPTRAVIGLRSLMFTAGGTSDVRGWGTGSLGPKVPDVKVGSGGAVSADRYLPVGGLARLTGSVELAMPFPLLPPAHRTFVFFDSGRVWSPGPEFQPADPALALEPWGHSVGGGLQFATPVGPLRLAVGYKLDPSRVDLLDPGDVARALASGEDLSGLPSDDIRRWHLHLAIGRGL